MRIALVVRTLIAVLLAAPSLSAQARVDRNVVYGMYSGLALLMDVHHPAQPNGYGLILIGGSGWHSLPAYGAQQLKSRGVPQILVDAGYTVFTINHRAAPRFRYPAAVEDAQRAVRFVRHHAERYGIDPNRLGGLGGSSGAHLVSMLATMDGDGEAGDRDRVNRESAKLQAVVVRASPTDFTSFDSGAASTVASFLGAPPGWDNATREASPITYVTSDDPPLLLIHGDADQTVPF
ncbi:MAG: alpha/beta hydrolase, partial [Longimicrobiales bacterium]